MREKAFTLIEVMVVMAVISILAGMMMPAVWRYWESQEIATTRERMQELKRAMVGDKNLVQNGVRTHFGFAGDFGMLPFDNTSSCAFSFLNSSAGMTAPRYDTANWSGRYLSSSADSAAYGSDAWGKPIQCTNKSFDADGRLVGLTLTSQAPNGGDLIEEVVDIQDVTPTNRVAGNLFASYSGLSISIRPEKMGAFTEITGLCKTVAPFTAYTTLLPYRLPIGGVHITLAVSQHNNCSSAQPATSFYYVVQDRLKVIKMPDLTSP